VGCGEHISFANVSVGAAYENNTVNNSPTQCTIGFYGFSSIKHDQDMLDLAGVNVNTFIFLLDFFTTEEDSRSKI
jgi:hypothetical protein